MDIENFKQAYYGKLEGIGIERIISAVNKLNERARSEGKELVLLCFEDVRVEGQWCHRTIFAQWWAEKVGDIIKELPDPTPPKGKVKQNNTKPVNAPAKEDSRYEQMNIFSIAGI